MIVCDCGKPGDHRHLALVELTFELMRNIFGVSEENAWYRVTEGVPRDAKLFHAEYNGARRVYRLIFEHPDFPDVPDGSEPSRPIHVLLEGLVIKEENHHNPH